MSNLIEKIHIENFQAHKDLTVDFGKEITSITGPSDRGKSAIIRALIWVITNRPNGDSFIRYGADECQVTITVGGHTIQRIKGKKRNCYIIDGTEFKALKTDVPAEVQKIFNISDNNIQAQFDPIFWFSATGGEVARNLNQIVNLDIIDFVLAELQSKSRQNKSEQDVINDLIDEQKQILEHEDKIQALSDIVVRIETITSKFNELSVAGEKIASLTKDIKVVRNVVEQANMWEQLYKQFDIVACKYIQHSKNKDALNRLLQYIVKAEQELKHNAIPEDLVNIIDKLYISYDALKEARGDWKKMHACVQDIEDITKLIEQKNKQAVAAEHKLHEILDNNTCPLCGRSKK